MRKIKKILLGAEDLRFEFQNGDQGRLWLKSYCENCTKLQTGGSFEQFILDENITYFFALHKYVIPPLSQLGADDGVFEYSWSQWLSMEFYYKSSIYGYVYCGNVMLGMSLYKNEKDSFCGSPDILEAIAHTGLDDLSRYIKNRKFNQFVELTGNGG